VKVKNVLLAVASLFLAVAAAEMLLRTVAPMSRGYSVQVPGTHWTIVSAPEMLRGVTGTGHFRVNDAGIRGRHFGPDGAEYRILAVGGSTTECAQLDDSEVWTSLLESGLRQTADGRSTWVGNVGRSGATARDHVLHLKYLLPQYPRIDAVLVMAGANDLLSALQRGWHYQSPVPVTEPAGETEAIHRAFSVLPPGRAIRTANDDGAPVRWYRETALWQLARRVKMRLHARRTYHLAQVGLLVRARQQRHDARSLIDSLPALDGPLADYRRNLNAMVDIAQSRGVRLVLVTQPSVWRRKMIDSEARLLWFGWLGMERDKAEGYFTTGALERAMAAFNRTVLDVCHERTVECVDADARLSGDSTVFYDDVHFTEAGSRALASLLSAHFAARAPFGGSGTSRESTM
jgi:hypothetical protein